jgi:hypothetical protein
MRNKDKGMKKTTFLSVAMIFLILFYWLYLLFNTNMQIAADALGYESLGRLFQEKGLVGYLQSGPTREPLYPATIAVSMMISSVLDYSYLKIQTVFQIMVVFLSMWMMYMVLRKIGVQQKIVFLCILYFGLSPAVINSALSLFSEIITYPLMLGIIWVSLNIYEALENTKASLALRYSVLLGLLMIGMTMVKATFELVAPIFLFVFMLLSWMRLREKAAWKHSYFFIFGLSLLVWASAIGEYKFLNQRYNGNFVITDRGPRHFFGNVMMRTEPLTQGRIKASLASVPGDGVCLSLATKADCAFWNFQQSDAYGLEEFNRLSLEDRIEIANKKLLAEGIKGIERNSVQYGVLTLVEAVKMFFWESTRVGFVDYPLWMETMYENILVKNGVRLIISLLTIISFFWAIFREGHRPFGITLILWLVSIFIVIHSLGSVLTRYSFSIGPFYICLIAFWLDHFFINQRQIFKN